MARIGVTYLEVVTAAEQITAQGEIPTVEKVRAVLQTGSNSTLSAHLRAWKSQKNQNGLVPVEGLPAEFVGTIKGLWQQLQDHAKIRISELEEAQQEKISEYEQKLNAVMKDHEEIQKVLNRMEDELLIQEHHNKNLTHQLNEEQKEKVKFIEKLAALENQLQHQKQEHERTHEFCKRLQDNIEDYQQKLQEQKDQFEAEKENIRLNHSEQLEKLQQNLITEKHQVHKLDLQCQQLQENETALKKSFADTSLEKSQLQNQLHQHQLKLEHQQEQIQILKEKLDGEESRAALFVKQHHDAERENIVLQTKLELVQNELHKQDNLIIQFQKLKEENQRLMIALNTTET